MAKPFTILDFDKTVFSKDSFIAFHVFCLLHNPLLILWLPFQCTAAFLRNLNLISTQQLKNVYLLFLAFYSVPKIKRLAVKFWKGRFPQQFNPEVLTVIEKNDPVVIITASPLVYFDPMIEQFPDVTFIGTSLKNKFGIYYIDGKNCKGPEKMVAFYKRFGPGAQVTAAYSDSYTDQPMFDAAANAYFVKKGRVQLIK